MILDYCIEILLYNYKVGYYNINIGLTIKFYTHIFDNLNILYIFLGILITDFNKNIDNIFYFLYFNKNINK